MTIDKVKLKDKKNTIYLPTTSYKDFYKNNFAIVYPNNGTAENPPTVNLNTRYVINNPFPGYYVHCETEFFIQDQFGANWGSAGTMMSDPGLGANGWGSFTSQFNDDTLVMHTGTQSVVSGHPQMNGVPFNRTQINHSSGICRIKVWKVGIIDG